MSLDLEGTKVVFWDFDGVIKESVQIKTNAFKDLFSRFGESISSRIAEHHLGHGGMSRFEKIPQYLDWAGLPADPATVAAYCERFAVIVEDAVVEAEWVRGVVDFLEVHHTKLIFVLVSATPQAEMESIVERLSLGRYFDAVYGAPTKKAVAIQRTLDEREIDPDAALMIGDSNEDLIAANKCRVRFLYRRSPENPISIADYDGPSFTYFE